MDMPESASCRCFRTAIDLLGKPWTGQILWILQEGPLRFNELATKVQGIGEKVLSARLKELECQGLLVRRVLPTTPVRVEYRAHLQGAGLPPSGGGRHALGDSDRRAVGSGPVIRHHLALRPLEDEAGLDVGYFGPRGEGIQGQVPQVVGVPHGHVYLEVVGARHVEDG